MQPQQYNSILKQFGIDLNALGVPFNKNTSIDNKANNNKSDENKWAY